MLNPYVLLALVLFYASSIGAVGYKAYHLGGEHVIAEQAETQELIDKVYDKAQQGAAEAISKLEVKNVTIRQKAETITREVPVYRDCHHDADGLRLLNEALAPGSEPAGHGELPGADPAH